MVVRSSPTSRSQRLFGDPIANRARRALEHSPLFHGRSQLIRITETDGRLVLEGRLPSYYLKQMLQTVLRDVVGVEQIDNRVTVDWPNEG